MKYREMRYIIILFGLITNSVYSQSFEWAANMGGANWDVVSDIYVDDLGNVYCTGMFQDSADFDPTGTVAMRYSNGGDDAFVVKYDKNGNFVWVVSLGGPMNDFGATLAIDNLGNINVGGYFMDSIDVDPGPLVQMLYSSGSASFICQYDSLGNYNWSFIIDNGGGGFWGQGLEIELDGFGYLYVTDGYGGTVDFDPSSSNAFLTSSSSDMYLAKYDDRGNFKWVQSPTDIGMNREYGSDIAVTELGDVYVIGSFEGTLDFKPNFSGHKITSNGKRDIFIAKYDSSGVNQWAHGFGDWEEDLGKSISLDNKGNVSFTGLIFAKVDFNAGPDTNYVLADSHNSSFVCKYDAQGNFISAFNFGSCALCTLNPAYIYHSAMSPTSIVVDSDFHTYVLGWFGNYLMKYDMDPGPDTSLLTVVGSNDIFFVKFDSLGNHLWSRSIGSPHMDRSSSLRIDDQDNIYLSGSFVGLWVDFNTGTGTGYLSSNFTGNQDGFVSKYSVCDKLMSHQTVEICKGEKHKLPNGKWTSQPIIDSSVIMSYYGCDSMIITDLQVDQVNSSIVKKGRDLQAKQDSAIYQWLECGSSGYSMISGENSRTFTPQSIGEYAVVVTYNGCSDTSECLSFNFNGINDSFENSIHIYPNPSNGVITIQSPHFTQGEVQLMNLQGELVYKHFLAEKGINEIILPTSVTNGLYFVRIESDNSTYSQKLVLQRE